MDITRVSDRVLMVDGVRYIRSWAGKKVKKVTSPKSRRVYMNAYRARKRAEITELREAVRAHKEFVAQTETDLSTRIENVVSSNVTS